MCYIYIVNNIRDSGAMILSEGLKRNTTLTELGMDSNEKTRIFNWMEKSWKRIYWIQKDNNIGDEGAKMISEALKSNSTLTALILTSNEKDNWIRWENCHKKKRKKKKRKRKHL